MRARDSTGTLQVRQLATPQSAAPARGHAAPLDTVHSPHYRLARVPLLVSFPII